MSQKHEKPPKEDEMIEIYGASDDLIEVDGDISEEFNYLSPHMDLGGDLLAFSDGTILRVTYMPAGIWRIVPVAYGAGTLAVEVAPENDDTNYTDKATLAGGIMWVVHGVAWAQ